MMNDDSEFSKLEREVSLLKEWLDKNHIGSERFPRSIKKYTGCIKKHKRWNNLSSSLVEFLRSKPLSDWTESDAALCDKAFHFDFFELSLLKPLSFDELLDLANQATAPIAEGFQLYLAMVCGKLQESRQQVVLATRLFENAQSFRVQLEVLKVLAENGSAVTDQCARKMWNSGDSEESVDWPQESVRQIAILATLRPIKAQKSLLDEYIAIALKSEYPSVASLAEGLAFIRDYGGK